MADKNNPPDDNQNDRNDSDKDNEETNAQQKFMQELQKAMQEFSVDKETDRLMAAFKTLGPALKGKRDPTFRDLFTMMRLVNYNIITVHGDTVAIYSIMKKTILQANYSISAIDEMKKMLQQIDTQMGSVLTAVSAFSNAMSLIDQVTDGKATDGTDGS